MVKQVNKLKKAEAATTTTATAEDILLLREIRDALKK
jgi:large-conductance mechanosensitive channel